MSEDSIHNEIFDDLLRLAVESGASDIVIKSNKPGYLRMGGRLRGVEMDPITGEQAQAFIDEHVPEVFRKNWERDGQCDFAYAKEDVGRFRVNAFHQRGSVSVVFRHIKSRPPTFEELNLDPRPLINLAQ